jgi:hypothetical protein
LRVNLLSLMETIFCAQSPPPLPIERLPSNATLTSLSVPRLRTPPPPSLGANPLLNVSRLSVSAPDLATAKSRNFTAPRPRTIELPLPMMLILLLMTGIPVAPKILL